MRFEAKHRYFKQLSYVIGNFKNICHSLSLRHQLHQCYLNLNRQNLPGEDLETGPGTCVCKIIGCFVIIILVIVIRRRRGSSCD